MSYVYLIGEPGNPVMKVGVAADPNKRVKELATGSPWDLQVLWARPGTRRMEQQFHRALSDIQVRREWFDFTGRDAADELNHMWRATCPLEEQARYEFEQRVEALVNRAR